MNHCLRMIVQQRQSDERFEAYYERLPNLKGVGFDGASAASIFLKTAPSFDLGLCYLASPYSNHERNVVLRRVRRVTHALADLTRDGFIVFSPIVHSHPLAEGYDLPKEFPFWERIDKFIISRSDTVLVLRIEGWEQSKGIKAEVEYAKEIGKRVIYLDYDDEAGYRFAPETADLIRRKEFKHELRFDRPNRSFTATITGSVNSLDERGLDGVVRNMSITIEPTYTPLAEGILRGLQIAGGDNNV